MAVRAISFQDGPFLTSGTFHAIINNTDPGAAAAAGYWASGTDINETTTTSYIAKADSAYDGPLGVSTDGLMLFLERSIGATGTFSVKKYEIGGSIEAEMTVNVSDLPPNGSPAWVFFKYPTPYVTTNAFYHNLAVKSSVNASVKIYRDGASSIHAYSFFTRKTSVAYIPVSGDTAFIVGELTGAASGTDRYVTPGIETGITVLVGQRGHHSAPPPSPLIGKTKTRGFFVDQGL
jgi:hypothetical protein